MSSKELDKKKNNYVTEENKIASQIQIFFWFGCLGNKQKTEFYLFFVCLLVCLKQDFSRSSLSRPDGL